MAKMNYYMGVDVGTSGCKAVVFDDAGHQVAAAYREYDVLSPHPGWAELDSDNVIARCFEVIAEAGVARGQDAHPRAEHIVAGRAFVPLDAAGKPLANAPVSSTRGRRN